MANEIREKMNVDEGIRHLIWMKSPTDPTISNDLATSLAKKDSDKKPEKGSKSVLIPTVMKEYVIVKKMLINNAIPDNNSHNLKIDKKVLYNMMLDLQRFRKLLLLKKSFFIFQ